jgi:hypothetical protein
MHLRELPPAEAGTPTLKLATFETNSDPGVPVIFILSSPGADMLTKDD